MFTDGFKKVAASQAFIAKGTLGGLGKRYGLHPKDIEVAKDLVKLPKDKSWKGAISRKSIRDVSEKSKESRESAGRAFDAVLSRSMREPKELKKIAKIHKMKATPAKHGGKNGRKIYKIDDKKWTCTCPDYIYRQAAVGGECKHIKAHKEGKNPWEIKG